MKNVLILTESDIKLIKEIIKGKSMLNDDTLTLTEKQVEICRLVSYGYSNAQIARALHISIHTVKTHLAYVFKKLDVCSRAELVAILLRNRVIE